jgi:hypothetical protein
MEKEKTGRPAWPVGRYFKYAIGEILLVVIGILIALQINNWNEERKTRAVEVNFLKNIKADLQLNRMAIDSFITLRHDAISSSNTVLDYFDGKKELDLDDFNYHSLNVMDWRPFQQNDNTYQELVNSGQLSIITNKAIKDQMQKMQSSFKNIVFTEGEMQQDFETYMYDYYFSVVDLNTNIKNYFQQINKETVNAEISRLEVEKLLNKKMFKNGFVLSNFNSSSLIEEYNTMKETTTELITLIDNEIKE